MVSELKNKVQLVTDRVITLLEQRNTLLNENASLIEENENLKQTLTKLNQELTKINIQQQNIHHLPASDIQEQKRKEIKNKITELAGEIDKCLALLNQ